MKDDSTVIEEFNDLVNMTVSELKSWIETPESKGAGWQGSGGSDGETVGHNSATKIIDILDRNPDKAADKYGEDDLAHMRKVVSYCKRHLAQEGHMAEEKSEAELRESKSYKSLKNWGHDSLKKGQGKAESKSDSKDSEKRKETAKEDKKEEDDKEEAKESKEDKAEVGEKRKAAESSHENDKDGEDDTDEPETKKLKEDDAEEADEANEEAANEKDEEATPTKKRGTQSKASEK